MSLRTGLSYRRLYARLCCRHLDTSLVDKRVLVCISRAGGLACELRLDISLL